MKKALLKKKKSSKKTLKCSRVSKKKIKTTNRKKKALSSAPIVSIETPVVVSTVEITTPKKPRKARSMYFTSDTENAIVEYNKTDDHSERCRIYEQRIRSAFEKIAENVFNTFKFSYNEVSPDAVQKEAVSHMVMNMARYDQSKGKAFGYFSVVAKNWFILENNMNYRRFKKHVEIVDEPGGPTNGEFIIESEHDSQDYDNKEFISLMVNFWDTNIPSYFSKVRDRDIASAVVHIFRHYDRIEIFNKKALYLYIREIANCQTQHITKVINKMMYLYKNIKDEYMNTGKITGNCFRNQNPFA